MDMTTSGIVKGILNKTDEIAPHYKWWNGVPVVFVGGWFRCGKSLSLFLVAGLLWLVNGELLAAQPDKEEAATEKPVSAVNSLRQPGAVSADSEEYCIRAGDTLDISVFQEAELSQKAKVNPAGSIRHPLLGVIQVGGLTISAAEKKIAELLVKDYLVNPRVLIVVDTYKARQVTLLGAVKSPGDYKITEQETVTLLQLIGRAGGFSNVAAQSRVTIIRMVDGKEKIIRVNVTEIIKSGDKSKDVELQSGDVVSVPESFF